MSLAIIVWIALLRSERFQTNHSLKATFIYFMTEQSIQKKVEKSFGKQRLCLAQNYTADPINMSFLSRLKTIELLNLYFFDANR